MKNDYHGLIYAYELAPKLGGLVNSRTLPSMPIAGRFRLIDFALSSLVNAGVRDVGVIMQRDYQSLLDHLGSGKDWDMSRRSGGLKLLPPFALPDSRFGDYKGAMEALSAIAPYIKDTKKEQFILCHGDMVANIDLRKAIKSHEESGLKITAVCTKAEPKDQNHRFITEGPVSMTADKLLCAYTGIGAGFASLETYIIEKELLLELISYCSQSSLVHFHREALTWYMQTGGRVNISLHDGFAQKISSVSDYYETSMKFLDRGIRTELFPTERPVRTKERAEVSTYYAETSKVKNCLAADGCYIEGEIENCILFRGVKVGKGVSLKNCIIMQDTIIEQDANLSFAVVDKDAVITQGRILAGSPTLPLVVPKGSTV
ncbi:glucose-1-phosphate adenylyltransferase subunit GlgD [Clostridiaceae bacterium OttesenSCG-928-D20]|nr:glucose-1-phosphate adenylyltransferase subunit GlgD [Clostridiaceae bacterium OttesenSCG-928-D20]